MKDTFMNNQMILIKILLKDVKTSYLPTTEVALSPCPLSPKLSADRTREPLLFGGEGVEEMELGAKENKQADGMGMPHLSCVDLSSTSSSWQRNINRYRQ